MVTTFDVRITYARPLPLHKQSLLKAHQTNLRKLLEAAKVSEATVDALLKSENSAFTQQDFLVYLDSEVESCETNSPMQNLLVRTCNLVVV
jgi:hypothetical protein